MQDNEEQKQPSIDPEEGMRVDGDVNVTGGGDFVGRDKIIITEETSFDVSGLPNPYLGLRAFGYHDRAAFGGRDEVIRKTVEVITKPGAEQTILFITGTSGSGKSSFAQAGLLPGLEDHYKDRYEQRCKAIFRPSNEPLSMLSDALKQLKFPKLTAAELSQFTPQDFARFIAEKTPKEQVNLLIIDQFEECFTQSTLAQREKFFSFLSALPAFDAARTHVILTMRSDFLDELFESKSLWEISKQGVELRKMDVEELKDAIQKPLWAAAEGEKRDERYGQKGFEPALLDRLAEDASPDAAYLPLLQLTLRELWNGGSLKLSQYKTLTTAIQRRAEAVYKYEDYEESDPIQERKAEDQTEILKVFIDLVDVSIDEENLRDVRKLRAKTELVGHSSQRERLVSDLINARLLSVNTVTSGAEQKEMVDIIHESLINNWGNLKEAIEKNRADLRKRARFEQQMKEWLERKKSSEYRLTGVRLKEALELERAGDVALRSDEAQELLLRSRERQTRNIIFVAVGLSIALLVAVVAAGVAIVSSGQLAFANATSEIALNHALTAEFSAKNAEGTAVAERIISDNARSTAQVAEQKAVDQRLIAESAESAAQAERNRAEEQATISLARQLSAQARELFLTQPNRSDLAVLLSIESLQLYAERGANQVLADTLRLLPKPVSHMALEGLVPSVAFNTDSQQIVSATSYGTIVAWEASTGKEIERKPHDREILLVVFSPDGLRVATADVNNTIVVWDLTSGEELPPMVVNSAIYAMAFSPDGQKVVSASEDRIVRVWDVISGQELASLAGENVTLAAAFTSDGKRVVVGGDDSTVKLWELENEQNNAHVIMTHQYAVTSVASSPDGKWIVSGANDGTIRVWDEVNGKEAVSFFHEEGPWSNTVYSINFSPDSRWIVSGGGDGTARVWEVASGQEIARMTNNDWVSSAAFSPDGRRIVSASGDWAITVWEPASGREITRLNQGDWVSAVAFSPDGQWVASGSRDGTLLVWEAATGNEVARMKLGNWISQMAFSPNGLWIVAGSADRTARIWEAATGREVARMTHDNLVSGAAFSPDGQQVVSASEDGEIILWEAASGMELTRMNQGSVVIAVAFSPNGQRVVSGGKDGTIIVWETASGNEVARMKHDNEATSVAFSPNSKWVVSGSYDTTARVWDAATGREVARTTHNAFVDTVVFSPDGRQVISSDEDGIIILWEAASGKEAAHMKQDGPVYSMAFSPDGRWVVSGSFDTTVRVWEAGTGQEVARMSHDSFVDSVAFSPDGRWIASGSSDESVRVWLWRGEDLIEMACSRLERNLTQAEWRQYFGEREYQQTCLNLSPGN